YARKAVAGGDATVVAVAEKDPVRRARFAAEHEIPAGRVFADWRELASAGRVADGVIIATQDSEHVEPAVWFAGLGYHILLEKPMATSEADCVRIIEAVERAGSMLAVCHVFRYTPYTRKIRELIAAGRIGTLGGNNLAVSAFSKRQATARDFVTFMTSLETERDYGKKQSFPLSRAALYDDPEMIKLYPYLPVLKEGLLRAKSRPVAVRYGDVTTAIQDNVFAALTEKKTADQAATDLQNALGELGD
ncbi:MAG TPA: Gfo/Idh/MocA family oxidoreductase, partial [Actinomadura sp.]|nr:Gfo/Idh/MocA family oxidoreductase [Actinomadura sp.]